MNTSDPSGLLARAGGSDFQPPALTDPRSDKDFDAGYYPQADGAPAPAPDPSHRNDRIKIEFCAVYYRLNRLHARLTGLRARLGAAATDGREQELMQEIERYLRTRDELEDRHAPHGVIAETIAREGYTVDIKFTFGDRNVLREQRTKLISSTALLYLADSEDSASNEDGTCKS